MDGITACGADSLSSDTPLRPEADESGDVAEFTKWLFREAGPGVPVFTGRRGRRGMMSRMVESEGGGEDELLLPQEKWSGGERRLVLLSPVLKRALDKGQVLCADGIDSGFHPALLLFLADLFNCPETNPEGAQLIMTTHATGLLSTAVLRRDQVFFVDRDGRTGVSEMHPLRD